MKEYIKAGLIALLVPAGSGPSALAAQQEAPRDTVTVVAGPEYAAGGLRRALLGDRWRDLWVAPVRAPVLNLATYAGGLTPFERGGTSQSIVLHMRGADGREYHFRSVNKDISQGFETAEDLRDTPFEAIVQEQTRALHPGAAFVVAPLLEAAGILHVTPQLFVMPDDPRLGEFREEFAGMLGMVEEKPDEVDDDDPVVFRGSEKIVGMEEMLERLEESPEHRIDARAYLEARLADFLVGDIDRGLDQWRWARYGPEGARVWQPIPRDRDWAFAHADGLILWLVRRLYPKLTVYGPDLNDIGRLTFMTRDQDRLLLSELPREAYDSAAAELQAELTDAAIERAVRALPPEYHALSGDELASAMRARREQLDEIARDYYAYLSSEVDVRATDEPDLAHIERRADGAVEVRLYRAGEAPHADDGENGEDHARNGGGTNGAAAEPYFRRVFLPDETGEVRVYLHGGDDRAVVSGSGGVEDGIVVRVIGGGGDDVLVDESGPEASSLVQLYDHRGENRFEPGPRTRVDERDWEEPEAGGGNWLQQKVQTKPRDFGGSAGFSPVLAYGEAAGLIVGASRHFTTYGFRRFPYARRIELTALVGVPSLELGAGLEAEWRRENSPMGFELSASASRLEAIRFFGFGNDTPEPSDLERTLVPLTQVEVAPLLFRDLGDRGRIAVGPVARWTDPRADADDVLSVRRPESADAVGQVGALAEAEADLTEGRDAPRRGLAFRLGGSAFPVAWDVADAFGEAHGSVAAWLPLGSPVLALRAGGKKLWGEFPVHEAAFVGGRETLRGFRFDRFAGSAAAWTGAELAVPIAEVVLFVRGRLGAFAFGDAARVWVDGESPGGWHTGVGGGLSFGSLGQTVRVSVAQGEGTRFYLDGRLAF